MFFFLNLLQDEELSLLDEDNADIMSLISTDQQLQACEDSDRWTSIASRKKNPASNIYEFSVGKRSVTKRFWQQKKCMSTAGRNDTLLAAQRCENIFSTSASSSMIVPEDQPLVEQVSNEGIFDFPISQKIVNQLESAKTKPKNKHTEQASDSISRLNSSIRGRSKEEQVNNNNAFIH